MINFIMMVLDNFIRNTLPVENGGQSGPILKQYAAPLIKQIKEKYPDTEITQVEEYKKLKTFFIIKNGRSFFYFNIIFPSIVILPFLSRL